MCKFLFSSTLKVLQIVKLVDLKISNKVASVPIPLLEVKKFRQSS